MFRSVCNFVWVDVGERRPLVCPIQMGEKGWGSVECDSAHRNGDRVELVDGCVFAGSISTVLTMYIRTYNIYREYVALFVWAFKWHRHRNQMYTAFVSQSLNGKEAGGQAIRNADCIPERTQRERNRYFTTNTME